MLIGEIFTAPVERLASGGAGLLHYQGSSIFMDNTAPGDLVIGRIIEEYTTWARAELVELTEPSPSRTAPVCPLYERCGGCSWQHIAYKTQVMEKARLVQDAFTHIGGLSKVPEVQIHDSPSFEYRNRVQFHRMFGTKTNTLGFKARKSETVVSVADCPIADPGIRLALREKRIQPPPEKDRFTVYARGQTFLSEGGIRRGKVSLLQRELSMDAGVFFQSNGSILEVLIQDLLKLAAEADHSLPMADLYCGVGTFSGFLQVYFSRIDLVEQNKIALSIARENVQGTGIQYISKTCDQWVKTLGRTNSAPLPYSFILMDPPRQGLSPLLRRWLSQGGPPLLVYVSCDPATLARDSRELIQGGYELENLSLYDFYPQTAHIESMAVFRK
jgi:23S rRNA (uracil1939-C5)-methyltransferase